ncbi:MAG TPA: DUF1579 domain-containing protein [Chthoniobacterales bacterium]|nr:DUF1579 domain-containing protein [Chthoniobacterales bacterium]
MKTLLTLAAAVVAAILTMPFCVAQDPTKPTESAIKKAQDRLPDDQPRVAQPASSPATASAGMPSKDEMMKMMMEMGKLNENHKLLGEFAGNWDYAMKMWMDPDEKQPQESKGSATRKPIMDGHYYLFEVTGKFDMPGPDGKPQSMDFKGMAIEGYDNAKKKFVSSWCDSMSTMIMNTEGTYDPATKTFTHYADCEMMPGMRVKMREVVKVVDKDRHTFEMYEDYGQGERKAMEIVYTRKK